MTFGSLFAGIGGFDLGFTRAGMECRWQVERDPFRRSVLARHWPAAERFDDVRTFHQGRRPESLAVDVISAGFPCQDISLAGRGRGIDGPESGVWRAAIDVVRILRPRFVVLENSPALVNRGLGAVLGALAAIGLDAEWQCVPSAAFGAPHVRDRLWIVAYPGGDRLEGPEGEGQTAAERPPELCRPVNPRMDRMRVLRELPLHDPRDACPRVRMSPRGGLAVEPLRVAAPWNAAESPVLRVVRRIPRRVDRVSAIGDAVTPAVAEWIGRRILAADQEAKP